jgi:hypothetical protein
MNEQSNQRVRNPTKCLRNDHYFFTYSDVCQCGQITKRRNSNETK